MPFVAVPDKNSGDVFTTAMWTTYLEGNLNAGANRPIYDSGIIGAATSAIDILSIPATFAHLLIVLHARGTAVLTNEFVGMRFDNDTTANYDDQYGSFNAAAAAESETLAATSGRCSAIPGASGAANWFGGGAIFIPNYAGATAAKHWIAIANSRYNTTTGTGPIYLLGGTWRSASAINRVTLIPQGGANFDVGSRFVLYGMGSLV